MSYVFVAHRFSCLNSIDSVSHEMLMNVHFYLHFSVPYLPTLYHINVSSFSLYLDFQNVAYYLHNYSFHGCICHSPTRGVMAEVKTELLWTTNVTPAPTTIAMYPASHSNGYGRSVEIKIGEMKITHMYIISSIKTLSCNVHPKHSFLGLQRAYCI